MKYVRMPIEVESPEEFGYDKIKYNLSESSVRDRTLSEVGIELQRPAASLRRAQGPPRPGGADRAGGSGRPASRPGEVLVTFGAAEALFIIATTLLEKGDQLVVIRPNYATNIFTPRAIEADIRYLDLTFEEQWPVDVDKLAALMTPRTKYVSITVPHNPTGQMMSEADLRRIVALVEKARLPPAGGRDLPRDDLRRPPAAARPR